MIPRNKSIQIVNSINHWRWHVYGLAARTLAICIFKRTWQGYFLFLESTIIQALFLLDFWSIKFVLEMYNGLFTALSLSLVNPCSCMEAPRNGHCIIYNLTANDKLLIPHGLTP